MFLSSSRIGRENPKSEYRNPKQCPKVKRQITQTDDGGGVLSLQYSVFGVVSDFVLRYSNFHTVQAPTAGKLLPPGIQEIAADERGILLKIGRC
jgi:hypothetical protein